MPELPEVETIRRALAPRVEGRVLERVVIRDPRWTAPDEPEAIAFELTGRRVERLDRRGEDLLWRVHSGGGPPPHPRVSATGPYHPAAHPGPPPGGPPPHPGPPPPRHHPPPPRPGPPP